MSTLVKFKGKAKIIFIFRRTAWKCPSSSQSRSHRTSFADSGFAAKADRLEGLFVHFMGGFFRWLSLQRKIAD